MSTYQIFKKRKFLFIAIPIAVALTMFVMSAFAAVDPVHVQFKLEGCRNNGGLTLPDSNGDFICPNSAYTTGNLGKGWNELDLVPHRITTDLGNQSDATTNYSVAIVADNIEAGFFGYDVISAPTVNAALSDPSCAVTAGPETAATPGIGGTDTSLFRILDITQNKNTTCVFDYYERLALGSSQYPGSSLHSNLTNQNLGTQGIGAKDVSIPVNEILPQELSKDMTATQDAEFIWNVTKAPSPANLTFADTCVADPAAREQEVTIRVDWEKIVATPTGDIMVVTNIYATNPASRIITVNVTDVIYSGLTPLDSANSGNVDVPANTEMLVLTHSFDVPAGTTDLNDIATATYTDLVTGVPVPGNTQATASATVQPSGTNLNNAASINDVENITGNYLSFSADSFSPAIGDFDGGYVAGTQTVGPVSWTTNPD